MGMPQELQGEHGATLPSLPENQSKLSKKALETQDITAGSDMPTILHSIEEDDVHEVEISPRSNGRARSPEGSWKDGFSKESTVIDSGSAAVNKDESFEENVRDQKQDCEDTTKNTRVAVEDVKVLKLSPDKMYELASSSKGLALVFHEPDANCAADSTHAMGLTSLGQLLDRQNQEGSKHRHGRKRSDSESMSPTRIQAGPSVKLPTQSLGVKVSLERPLPSRTVSTPVLRRKQSNKPANNVGGSTPQVKAGRAASSAVDGGDSRPLPNTQRVEETMVSPALSSIPMPPFSIPAHLQLELSSNRPSPLYIYQSSSTEFPYEPSQVKVERLLNFLLLPPHLELVLWFGTFACLDAWLYTFTILPLRFLRALYLLARSWGTNMLQEIRFVAGYIYNGLGRVWRRRKVDGLSSEACTPATETQDPTGSPAPNQRGYFPSPVPQAPAAGASPLPDTSRRRPNNVNSRHRRNKSAPSPLMPNDKADILKGLLIISSCGILMYFDASMMYHSIRGQAAIKLYVIYNALEVCDRLLSALGQDVLECLFSKESLERKPNGRSKVLRPFWLFILALLYTVLHSIALFYQVITLNVAVNSYSNALLTLLMSNQFVEIKSSVFKRIEKENLFQLTCADVVERFQIWLMLMIIASRNIVETSGLGGPADNLGGNNGSSGPPAPSPSLLPSSFTMFPDWIGQIMSPFLLVLGTEILVDWLKHAYITKFNNTKPNVYGRFLDVLAKDYYSNAFADQNLTRRIGLPVIPLSCLFIRASVQTYHMFLAATLPLPFPSATTALSVDSDPASSPSTTAALHQLDQIVRRALGRSGFPPDPDNPTPSSLLAAIGAHLYSADAVLASLTTLVFFLILFLVLLVLKLVLGMCLLSFARHRYDGMKRREAASAHAEGSRSGGWGVVEMGDAKRKWIYEDDAQGLARVREKAEKNDAGFGTVERYSMVAKRIW